PGLGISLVGSSISVRGTLRARNGGSLDLFSSTTVDQLGSVAAQAGGTITVRGDLVGSTRNADQFTSQGAVSLQRFSTASSPQLLEAMSADLGTVPAGF